MNEGKREGEKVGGAAPPPDESHSPTFPSAHSPPRARRDLQDLQRLIPLLRGDLDWIVMKCLEKDRNRRYETASGLAADIQRHLSHEPITAGPPSTIYRLRKFTRKHRAGVAVAAAFVVLLAAAAVISLTFAFRADRERGRAVSATAAAVASATESSNVLQFFTSQVLQAPRPKGQFGGRGIDVTLRSALHRAEPSIARYFTNQPLVEAAVRTVLGDTYRYLGQSTNAIVQLTRAYRLRAEHLGTNHLDTLDSLHALAIAYASAGRFTNAILLSEEVVNRKRAILGPLHRGTIISALNLAVD